MGSISNDSHAADADLDYDVIVIGAGLSGIYSLHRMLKLGLRAVSLEAGSAEGGTWYWNRYPGCRFDSESWTYGFSFSQEILDEWSWTEHFAPGPETRRYAEFLTKKLDIREQMQFNTKVVAAHFQQDQRLWRLVDDSDRVYTSRFLITGVGILNEPTLPAIAGVETFAGESFHTSRWPDHYTLAGKRVGIIGTGATGIQIMPEIAKMGLTSLTVFQRTANWSAPLHNEKISPEEMDEIRKKYPEIFEKCRNSWSCFIHSADSRKTFDVPEDERLAFWEDLYSRPGFSKWLGNFGDINFDRVANAAFSNFIANKIRERVHDPETAEKLIPKNHGFGTRRVPLESHYLEAYNQDNVRLVDVSSEGTPIQRITPTAVVLLQEEIELDILIFATGFDALTGAFDKIDFRGVNGVKLKDRWRDGPQTFLGMFVRGFPNMTMIMGPHEMFGNFPRSIEYAVDFSARFVKFCENNGITYAEATEEKMEEWGKHVRDSPKGLLMNEVDSWMTGVNKNVSGKQKRIVARYNGPAWGFRKRCEDVASRNYEDLRLA